MSLLSIFYAGDRDVIERSVEQGELNMSEAAKVQMFDFSGGISCPWLFPGDFLILTKGGSSSFWHLRDENLAGEQEHGFYRLPESELGKLQSLSEDGLREFSESWNTRRKNETSKYHSRPIWWSKAYWKITLGGLAGFLAGSIAGHGDRMAVIMLVTWIICATVAGLWLNRSQRRHRKNFPAEPGMDWVPVLRELQRFLTRARENGLSVYYYWSL
jgi:hypothetical protein